MDKIDLIITDDHALFRKGVISILQTFDFIKSIDEAGDGIELLSKLRNKRKLPDIILLDIKMPKLNGFETNKRIKQDYPEVKVIILSMIEEEQFIIQMIKEGVNGYLLKDSTEDQMNETLQSVIKYDYYFSEEMTKIMHKSIINIDREKKAQSFINISDRELEVLRLLCMECTASEIAKELFISSRTVEKHKFSLMEKTNSRNTVGLAVYAIKNGLVSLV